MTLRNHYGILMCLVLRKGSESVKPYRSRTHRLKGSSHFSLVTMLLSLVPNSWSSTHSPASVP